MIGHIETIPEDDAQSAASATQPRAQVRAAPCYEGSFEDTDKRLKVIFFTQAQMPFVIAAAEQLKKDTPAYQALYGMGIPPEMIDRVVRKANPRNYKDPKAWWRSNQSRFEGMKPEILRLDKTDTKTIDMMRPQTARAVAEKVLEGKRVSPSTLNSVVGHWVSAAKISSITGVHMEESRQIGHIGTRHELKAVMEYVYARASQVSVVPGLAARIPG